MSDCLTTDARHSPRRRAEVAINARCPPNRLRRTASDKADNAPSGAIAPFSLRAAAAACVYNFVSALIRIRSKYSMHIYMHLHSYTIYAYCNRQQPQQLNDFCWRYTIQNCTSSHVNCCTRYARCSTPPPTHLATLSPHTRGVM